jgi:hypothetical protein
MAEKVRPMFMRGDYDVGVFQAFKDVEIAVRRAAGLSDSDIGRKLMQAAFRPEGGPLTAVGDDKGEWTCSPAPLGIARTPRATDRQATTTLRRPN